MYTNGLGFKLNLEPAIETKRLVDVGVIPISSYTVEPTLLQAAQQAAASGQPLLTDATGALPIQDAATMRAEVGSAPSPLLPILAGVAASLILRKVL